MRQILLLFVLPLLLTGIATAQAAIRILQVPERLQLPAARGANLLLEVEVLGTPDAVWLATDAAAMDRLPLVPSGEQRFQKNLADPALLELLPAGRDHGELLVHARYGARTVQSASIGWSRIATDDGKVRCLVRSKGTATHTATPDQALWVDPANLERIEVQGAGARQSTTVARLEDHEQPLVRHADDGLWVLDVDARLRERLHAVRAFEIEVHHGATSSLFTFRCVPASLPLDPDRPSFTVQQRRRAWLPGSNEWLQVRIDDITMGQVQFELVTAEGATVIAGRPVRERDHFEFALAKGHYVLVLRKLHNSLLGEDHAEFAIEEAATFTPDPVGLLLDAVRQSGDTFLREDKEYTGALAAQFLAAKLGSHRGPAPTVDEFVDVFASQSSRTGAPYHVRLQDGNGTLITMREWLRTRQKELDAAGARRPRARK